MKLIKTSMMCLAAGLCLAAQAQTSRTELMAHLDLATGNYCNYPNPSGHITPAPDGYEPFYVTHYGRYGARYMTSDKHYKYTIGKMDRTPSDGELSVTDESGHRRQSQLLYRQTLYAQHG